MIKFENFTKYFNKRLILSIPDFELNTDIYWLKGENGAGKTTLMKSIAGLIPFNGAITVMGIDIKKQRIPYRLIVNYAEAEPQYPTFLTGNDLINLYAETKNASKEQINNLVELFGVSAFADNKIGTYSSGMVKKLSLVLGFMGSAKFILLDEPLITLDKHSVGILQNLIETYFLSGVSFLISSHQDIIFREHIAAKQLLIKDNSLIKS